VGRRVADHPRVVLDFSVVHGSVFWLEGAGCRRGVLPR
jgi:hypothetical protein